VSRCAWMLAVVPMSAWPASIWASLRLPVRRRNSVIGVCLASCTGRCASFARPRHSPTSGASEASARVEQKVSVVSWWRRQEQGKAATEPGPEPKAKKREPEPEPRELVIFDAEPHCVDGEPVYR
jgi:hypothetical protein